ncbi:glycosyltransferase family 2 protein [Candidatus Latescibacterota bacterium]
MMGKPPLVSVVTPCFNGVEFIERCIESVLAQDYPHVEHIIQDGASTDGTVEILKKYSRQVDWVSETDSGQSDGLNRALRRCRGDVICVLNADDELLPHAASWAVENLAKYPDVAVVYGDQYIIDVNGAVLNEYVGPEYDFEKNICVETIIPAQAAFIRRSHFEEVGFYADSTLESCPDYEMWVRISLKYPLVHVPGFVCRYRFHPNSEGHRIPIIEKMIQSKSNVMDRLFNDPSIPDAIKALQRRAYSGNKFWGAVTLARNGSTFQASIKLLHSLWLFHSKARLVSFMRLLKKQLCKSLHI